MMFDPFDWHWIVGGDESRFWSSASSSWVETLPEGAGVTRIANGEELTGVLAVYGLKGPLIRPEDINAERSRRIVAGKIIDGIYVTGRDEDTRNLINLALAAQVRIAGGDTVSLTTFRDGNDVDHELTPPQMLSLWQQSAEYVSWLYEASWAIKAMDPLPADFADDAHWPA